MKLYNIIRTCLQKILNISIVVVGHNVVFIREEGGSIPPTVFRRLDSFANSILSQSAHFSVHISMWICL